MFAGCRPSSRNFAAALATSILCCTVVWAGEVNDILQHERKLLAAQCAEIEFYPGFIEMTDLNGDGWEDAIVDYQYLQCGESSSAFCGSGGCTLRLYSGGRGGHFTEAGEFLSYGLKIQGKGKNARISISVHGSECGVAGASPCMIVGRLEQGRFIVERKR